MSTFKIENCTFTNNPRSAIDVSGYIQEERRQLETINARASCLFAFTACEVASWALLAWPCAMTLAELI